jgi:hypothetical protein
MNSGRGIPEYARGGMSPRSELSLLAQKIENILVPGKVIEVDHTNAYARVSFKDEKGRGVNSDWLRWTEKTSGDDREWSPPSVGERVIVLFFGGNVNNGIILSTFNVLDYPPNCDDKNVSRKTWGKPLDQSFFDYPFWQISKAKGSTHLWNYLPSKGEMRHEIGEDVVIHWTEKFLMFRIKENQLVLTPDGITITSADKLDDPSKFIEIQAQKDKAVIHVDHKAAITINRSGPNDGPSVNIHAEGITAINMDSAGFRVSHAKAMSLELSSAGIYADNRVAKARMVLAMGVSSMALDGVSMILQPNAAVLGMNGSGVLVSPSVIELATSTVYVPEPPVLGASPATVAGYEETGPATEAQVTEPTDIVPKPPRWDMMESKGPKYPRTGKPKV